MDFLYRHRFTLAKPAAATALLASMTIGWPGEWGMVMMLLATGALVLLGLLELGVVVTLSRARQVAESSIGDHDPAPDPLTSTLDACLGDAAARVGVAVPSLALLRRSPAAVTGSAQAQTGSAGTSVAVSLASALLLGPTPERLTAVLAHELAHLRHHDLRTMAVFVVYATVLLSGATGAAVVAALRSPDALAVGMVVLACALAFEPVLMALKAAFLRHCEDRADTLAAAACGTRTYAEALLLLHAQHVYGGIPEPVWPALLAERPSGLAGLRASPILAAFGCDPQAAIIEGTIDSRAWAERMLSRLRDPHRPDAERVRRLGLDPREVIIGL